MIWAKGNVVPVRYFHNISHSNTTQSMMSEQNLPPGVHWRQHGGDLCGQHDLTHSRSAGVGWGTRHISHCYWLKRYVMVSASFCLVHWCQQNASIKLQLCPTKKTNLYHVTTPVVSNNAQMNSGWKTGGLIGAQAINSNKSTTSPTVALRCL